MDGYWNIHSTQLDYTILIHNEVQAASCFFFTIIFPDYMKEEQLFVFFHQGLESSCDLGVAEKPSHQSLFRLD